MGKTHKESIYYAMIRYFYLQSIILTIQKYEKVV